MEDKLFIQPLHYGSLILQVLCRMYNGGCDLFWIVLSVKVYHVRSLKGSDDICINTDDI